jgi:hypothetical protein
MKLLQIALILFVFCSLASAEIYKYVDPATGAVEYTVSPKKGATRTGMGDISRLKGCPLADGSDPCKIAQDAIDELAKKNADLSPTDVTVERQNDEFERHVVFLGPIVNDFEDGSDAIHRLVAYVDKKSGATQAVLVWRDEYTRRDWKFWSRAQASGAVSLTLATQDRKVIRCQSGVCDYFEFLAFEIPNALLPRLLKESVEVKLTSKDGEPRVIMLAQHHWQAIDAAIKKARGAARKKPK